MLMAIPWRFSQPNMPVKDMKASMAETMRKSRLLPVLTAAKPRRMVISM
jgi:hypothetical protein